jgi:hypothetical protein
MVAHDNGKGTPVKVNTGMPKVPSAQSNPIAPKPNIFKANAPIKRSNTLHR